MGMITAVEGLFGKVMHRGVSCPGMSRKKAEGLNLPVQIALRATKRENGTNVFIEGRIITLDRDSVCIEFNPCLQCSGFQEWGVHTNCIFSRYNGNLPGSLTMAVYVRMPGVKQISRFRGRALAITRKGSKEIIKVKFENTAGKTAGAIDIFAMRHAAS